MLVSISSDQTKPFQCTHFFFFSKKIIKLTADLYLATFDACFLPSHLIPSTQNMFVYQQLMISLHQQFTTIQNFGHISKTPSEHWMEVISIMCPLQMNVLPVEIAKALSLKT